MSFWLAFVAYFFSSFFGLIVSDSLVAYQAYCVSVAPSHFPVIFSLFERLMFCSSKTKCLISLSLCEDAAAGSMVGYGVQRQLNALSISISESLLFCLARAVLLWVIKLMLLHEF